MQPGEGQLVPALVGLTGEERHMCLHSQLYFHSPTPRKYRKFPKGMKWALCALKHTARKPVMTKSSLEEGMGVPAPAGLFLVPCGFDLFL